MSDARERGGKGEGEGTRGAGREENSDDRSFSFISWLMAAWFNWSGSLIVSQSVMVLTDILKGERRTGKYSLGKPDIELIQPRKMKQNWKVVCV